MLSPTKTADGYAAKRTFSQRIHIDIPLLLGLLTLMAFSIAIIYAASGQNDAMIKAQVIRMGISLAAMVIIAQISPSGLRRWSMPLFGLGLGLLVATLLFGHVGKGAQRWLNLGIVNFQTSEAMKVILPIVVAHFITTYALPPKLRHVIIGFIIVIIPTLLIAKQPDLGTSILVASSGVFALFLAGMSWRIIGSLIVSLSAFAPVLWFFLMRDYQRQRVMTFLNPESDPLGSGYHIIQSKIAIGSGGLSGKGWLNGTQSQLEFLPERHTDFIFSVLAKNLACLASVHY